MAMKLHTKILIAIGILVALSIAAPAFIVFFVVRPVRVEGEAMKPTLNDGDRILLQARSAGDKLSRGEIVIFYYPKDTTKSYVKRIVGLPGEKFEIREGEVFINDQALSESYIASEEGGYERAPTTMQIPAEHYFMLGDNRNFSSDSRDFGSVPDNLIYGKMLFRYLAVN